MNTLLKNILEYAARAKKHRATCSFIILGVSSTLWFLFRVLPKPSRAAYPCMRASYPMMSGFILWVLAATGATFAFNKAKYKLYEARYVAAALFIMIGIGSAALYTAESTAQTNAKKLNIWYKPNAPLGIARGIIPGRVAWGHNPKVASWDEKTEIGRAHV